MTRFRTPTLAVLPVFALILTPAARGAEKADAAALSKIVLDDAKPEAERLAVVHDHPELSADLIAAMTADLTPGTKEEYRRIPWIWRVAIEAGKSKDPAEMKTVLGVALPQPDCPLHDWRAVVIGGGLVNGITLAGDWPAERLAKIVEEDQTLAARWKRSLELAAAMADDEKISTGTRYDALRMVGVLPWDRGGAQLFRYLLKGVHPELQQGAVCALGDVRAPAAAQALLSGFAHYSQGNREFALDALLRDPSRTVALLDAVADGRVKRSDLGEKRVEALRTSPDQAVRAAASELFSK